MLAGVAVALGLAFGSFLNVVIHRLPREQSVVTPASRCPVCGASIRAWNNLPVVSWIALRGRARCCGARISPRYPLVELIGGLMAWAILERIVLELPAETVWWMGLLVFAVYLALGLGLVAAAFIDLDFMFLPDEITLGGAVLGLLTVPIRPSVDWADSLVGAAVGFLVVWLLFDLGYRLLRGQSGMGLGDAKLLMLSGAWFGWQGAMFSLLAGAVQGTIVAIVVFLVQGRIEEPEAVRAEREQLRAEIERAEGEERERLEKELELDPIGAEPGEGLGQARVAFGPFLVLATIEYMVLGEELVSSWARGLMLP